MKKFIVMLLLLSVFTPKLCFADPFEEPILFRGAKWGSSFSKVKKVLPDGVEMYPLEARDFWFPIEVMMYDGYGYGERYNAQMGCYSTSQSYTLKDVTVAGYDVEDISLLFLYKIGKDGSLVKDNKHTSLILASYTITPKDLDSVYADLVKKLTSLYGDVDSHQEESSVITHKQDLWYGADDTMVSLVSEDYKNGSHTIYIKYGTAKANEQMKAAYDSIAQDEAKKAGSNTDGL